MEQEWRASATAAEVPGLSDDQFDELLQHVRGTHRYHADTRTLHLVWRVEADTLEEAARIAMESALIGLAAARGGHAADLVDFRVVSAEVASTEG